VQEIKLERNGGIVISVSRKFVVEGGKRGLGRSESPQDCKARSTRCPGSLLFITILPEVAGITSIKLSRGFVELVPSIAVPVFYVLSAAAVIFALKRLDLSVTYAIWSGVGTALAVMIGIAYFREPLTLLKLVSLLLVVIGIVGLSLGARQTN
jgi:small multidrug resistance pump